MDRRCIASRGSVQSFERAGDVASAINAYRVVLKHTAARVPRTDAEQKLAALKKKHPKYFEPKKPSEGAAASPQPPIRR